MVIICLKFFRKFWIKYVYIVLVILEMLLSCNYVSKVLISKRKLYGIFYYVWINLDDWKYKLGYILYYIYGKKSRKIFSLYMLDVKVNGKWIFWNIVAVLF